MNASTNGGVWANDPANAMPTSSANAWMSTLVDIVSQWGWLFAAVIIGVLVTVAFGDRRPNGGR